MTVYDRTVRYVDWGLTAVAGIMSIGTLYLWLEAMFWWGDVGAFASAAAWTTLTLVMWGVVMVVEWLRQRGE